MNRTDRLLEIRRLIKKNKIGNQEELLKLLDKSGFMHTQATLSRDLKFLKVGKIADEEKGQVYFLSGEPPEVRPMDNEFKDAVSRGFLSVEFSGNMAVVKTLPGFASGIAYRIDGMRAFEIIGTIAGDDTILVIARDGLTRQNLHDALNRAIPAEQR